MRSRYLRIAVTVLSLTACILLLILWLRSYSTWEVWRSSSIGGKNISVSSLIGRIEFSMFESPPVRFRQFPTGYQVGHVDKSMRLDDAWAGMKTQNGNISVWLPHWLWALPIAVVAYVPWIRSSRRFSLRALLIATTLVAVALGLIVLAAR